MGSTDYNFESRAVRTNNYVSQDFNETFTQQEVRRVHESMDSKAISFRESRDSDVHPETFPIIIALDVTGSMGHIPHYIIKHGLPLIVEALMKAGIKSPAILFMAIGDHECDRHPLQIGQFESGDQELDMWLTRTYIESGGGGNAGESYSLAHYFAATRCQTDSFDKRNKKGVLITVGDEPNLKNYPSTAMNGIFHGNDNPSFTEGEAVDLARQQWEPFHILPRVDNRGAGNHWRELLGNENVITAQGQEAVAQAIIDIVVNCYGVKSQGTQSQETQSDTPEEIL